MRLKPLYERIAVIIEDKQEVVSKAGLTYTKNMSISANTTMTARVVAVGEGRLMADGTIVPLKVKVGDKILYSKMHGESYNDGTDDYVLLAEQNVIAVLEEDDNGDN